MPHSTLIFDVLCYSERTDLDEFLGTIRLVLNSCGIELGTRMLNFFEGPKEGFLSLLQYIDVPYYETSMNIRGGIALNIAERVPYNSPDLFRVALHPGPISQADVVYKSYCGETLLYAVAQAIGRSMRPTCLLNKIRNQRECRDDL